MSSDGRVLYWYHPQADEAQIHDPRIRETKNEDTQHLETKTKSTIETLLHHYRDVLEGIPDREHRTSDDLLALMCPAWNSPAYQQLEHLLERMPGALRQALRVRFERYTERRVAYCRKCGASEQAQKVGKPHPGTRMAGKLVYCKIKGRTEFMRPKLVRVLPSDDDPRKVQQGLEWLVAHWSGEALLPKAVEQIESERKLAA